MNLLSTTLSTYLVRQFLISFIAVLAIIVGLIMLFDTIELLRRTVAVDNAGLAEVLTMVALKVPHTIQDTLPFIVMVAMMYMLFRLARSHEIVVMRAAGVSVWQLLGPPLATVAAIGLFNLLIFNPFAATLYETYQRAEDALLRNQAAVLNVGEGGLWLREAEKDKASVVHAESIRHEPDALYLTTVSIFEIDSKEKLLRRIEAKDAKLAGEVITLHDAWDMASGRSSIHHDTLEMPTTITLEKIQDSFASPESMSVWGLPQFIRFQMSSGFSAVPHRLYWQSLLASPFMLLAMVLVASGFYLSSNTRRGLWLIRGVAGLGAGFLFYFFNRFTYALGLSSTLPLLLAAWAPTVVAALVSLAYLFHREDG